MRSRAKSRQRVRVAPGGAGVGLPVRREREQSFALGVGLGMLVGVVVGSLVARRRQPVGWVRHAFGRWGGREQHVDFAALLQ